MLFAFVIPVVPCSNFTQRLKVRKDLNGHRSSIHNSIIYINLFYDAFTGNCTADLLFANFVFFATLREIKMITATYSSRLGVLMMVIVSTNTPMVQMQAMFLINSGQTSPAKNTVCRQVT